MTSTKQQRRKDREIRQAVDQEMRVNLRVLIVDRTAGVIRTFVKYGFVCGLLAYMTHALAGQATSVQIDAVLKLFASKWVYLTIAGMFGAGWIVRDAALKKRIKTISDQKKMLEEAIDPGRSTSGMKPDGTPPRNG